MNKRSIATYLILIALSLTFLGLQQWKVSERLHVLERNILLTRVTSPGRTKAEVVHYLGQPDEQVALSKNQGRFSYFLIYKSSTHNLNGTDDLWLGMDKNHLVVIAFYPDMQQDRKMVEALVDRN